MKTPDFSRRDFVKGLSAATLGALGAGYPRALVGAEGETLRPPATADTIIVLWMGGGMASSYHRRVFVNGDDHTAQAVVFLGSGAANFG